MTTKLIRKTNQIRKCFSCGIYREERDKTLFEHRLSTKQSGWATVNGKWNCERCATNGMS